MPLIAGLSLDQMTNNPLNVELSHFSPRLNEDFKNEMKNSRNKFIRGRQTSVDQVLQSVRGKVRLPSSMLDMSA